MATGDKPLGLIYCRQCCHRLICQVRETRQCKVFELYSKREKHHLGEPFLSLRGYPSSLAKSNQFSYGIGFLGQVKAPVTYKSSKTSIKSLVRARLEPEITVVPRFRTGRGLYCSVSPPELLCLSVALPIISLSHSRGLAIYSKR